jgi:diguanylate cyclase (GGDEF)-like protein
MSGVVNTVLSFLSEQYELILYVMIAATLLVVASWLVRRMGRQQEEGPGLNGRFPKPYDEEKHRLQGFVNELRDHNRELKKRITRLTNQNAVLAPLIKELNSNLDRRRMGPIVLRVMERIFSPKQALVFFTESDRDTLTLVSRLGAENLPDGYRQQIGEGFAGLVAKKRLTVMKDDLCYESNLTMKSIDDLGPESEGSDIATPILNRDEPLGVLCMGGMREFNEDDKALFGMIANMTALALMNYLQYRKIEELANHDPLTGVYNKGHFLRVATDELETAKRESTPMSVLMLDVDHFKHYNDTNGHLAGDRLLTGLADILKTEVREHDVVGRFGGEEFIILLHGVGLDEAFLVADRIRTSIAGHPFENGRKQPLGNLTVSGGVSSMPLHGSRLETLTERADEALYAAKNAGRNQVHKAGDGTAVSPIDVEPAQDEDVPEVLIN